MRDWQALTALILSTGVSGAVIILAVQELMHNGHIDPEEGTVFATVLGGAVGAVAVYLGGRRNGRQ